MSALRRTITVLMADVSIFAFDEADFGVDGAIITGAAPGCGLWRRNNAIWATAPGYLSLISGGRGMASMMGFVVGVMNYLAYFRCHEDF
jgi:hypothetical protein